MSKMTLVRTTSALIVSSSAHAEKWRGVRSVFGLVTEIASAPSRSPKKSDNFAPKDPVEVIAPKAEIRPEEAEEASAPSEKAVIKVVEDKEGAGATIAELKARYAKAKAAKAAKKN